MNKTNAFICFFMISLGVFSADISKDNDNNLTGKYNQLLNFFIDNHFPPTGTQKCGELVGVMKNTFDFANIHATGTITMIDNGQTKLAKLLEKDALSGMVVYHIVLTAVLAGVKPGQLFHYDPNNDYGKALYIIEYRAPNGIKRPITTYSVWASMLEHFDKGNGNQELKDKLLLVLDNAIKTAKTQLDRYAGPLH